MGSTKSHFEVVKIQDSLVTMIQEHSHGGDGYQVKRETTGELLARTCGTATSESAIKPQRTFVGLYSESLAFIQ